MDKYSYLSNAHNNVIEGLYEDYKKDNQSVDVSWQKFFEGFDLATFKFGEEAAATTTGAVAGAGVSEKEIQVRNLIFEYRRRAHLKSKTNPVRERKDRKARLE
ncbi:MAG: hypothetical protein RL060_2054, partial [Bacteroidota bacterium]